MAHDTLPNVRASKTRKFKIPYFLEDGTSAELKFYVTAGMYDNGRLGEIFVRTDKQGTFINGMLDAFAMAFSIGLQHGVPLEKYIEKMRHSRFEPSGVIPDSQYRTCSSALDLIAHWLEDNFGPKSADSQLASVP